jgi:hypothetical protein
MTSLLGHFLDTFQIPSVSKNTHLEACDLVRPEISFGNPIHFQTSHGGMKELS